MRTQAASTSAGTSGTLDPRLSQGRWLRIPGPTVVHPDAVKAQTRDMIAHRGPAAAALVGGVHEKLRAIHETAGDVLVWSGSGSAGWEAAITNLLSPGDRVVATVCGAFGGRFAAIGTAFGLDVRRVEVPWGEAIPVDLFEAALAETPDVKAVFITHNETSTGVTNPLPELAAAARRHDALVIVDAVSSAAALPLKVDAWGLDWVLSGSQKAWMCPPGLMIAAVSERALAAATGSGYPTFFWDVLAMKRAADSGSTATTAPISLLFALDAATTAMLVEGIHGVRERHHRLSRLVREGVRELGLELLADDPCASDSITALRPPPGMTAGDLRGRVRDASGIEIAVGQGGQTEAIVRIGHMGWVEEPELHATLEAIALAIGPAAREPADPGMT